MTHITPGAGREGIKVQKKYRVFFEWPLHIDNCVAFWRVKKVGLRPGKMVSKFPYRKEVLDEIGTIHKSRQILVGHSPIGDSIVLWLIFIIWNKNWKGRKVSINAEVEILTASNLRPLVDKTLVSSNLRSITVSSDVDVYYFTLAVV